MFRGSRTLIAFFITGCKPIETITLSHYLNEISSDKPKRKVSMAGYDTDLFRVPYSVYIVLPQYRHDRD